MIKYLDKNEQKPEPKNMIQDKIKTTIREIGYHIN